MARQLLLNPGFETGAFAPFWITTGTTAIVSPPDTHTGTNAAQLSSPSTGPAASISQIVLTPFNPLALLKLSFFANKRNSPKESNITADVTLLSIFPPFILPGFITIFIPAASNPTKDANEFIYYEGYSQIPVPFGITGAIVTITNGLPTSSTSTLTVDDVFLVEDVL